MFLFVCLLLDGKSHSITSSGLELSLASNSLVSVGITGMYHYAHYTFLIKLEHDLKKKIGQNLGTFFCQLQNHREIGSIFYLYFRLNARDPHHVVKSSHGLKNYKTC